MKKILVLAVVMALVASSAQAAITLMDSTTNNGSFESPVNTGADGENTQRVLGSAGWTLSGGQWSMFTHTSYVPNSVSDGDWGWSVNHNVNATVISDDIAVSLGAGETIDLSFTVGNNSSNGSTNYTARLFIDGVQTNLGAYLYEGSDILTAPAHKTVNFSYELESAASTIAVFINVNNNTGSGGTDQAYVDNVVMTATPEPTTIAMLGFGALGLLRRKK